MDWFWRPAPWAAPLKSWRGDTPPTGFGVAEGVTLHHDSQTGQIAITQQTGARDRALTLEWSGFRGSYVSLALALPALAAQSLSRDHIIALTGLCQSHSGGTYDLRLNMQGGPNLSRQSAFTAFGPQPATTAFELLGAGIKPGRINHLWLDVIFPAQESDQVLLRDLVVTRYRRAAC